jgi:CHAT domain-containing protein/tetratricopeptide (TPR) repeat protein
MGETVREANAHLTLDEIFEALRPLDQEVDGHLFQELRSHLAGCAECAGTVDQYRGVMAELNPFKRGGKVMIEGECPRPDIWVEVATGLLSSDDALRHLEHAALCSSCSAQLKEALEIVGANAPPELELHQALQTGTPARQKSLAVEMAARSRQILQSEAASGPIPFKKPSRTFRLPVWAYGAVAAVLVLGVALAIFTGVLGRGSGSTERLLAQAYAQQRTVELRLPGAGYGPVRVERGPKQSHMSSPGVLLEAEAEIKKGLEQHPDDPNLLRQKAEADLLNWDYQPAIETLGHALRLQPQSPKLLVDLATAHFERAEATDTPADYESALQYLGDALRLAPKDPAALFNRAIIHERLFLYSRAIADWELLLTVEGDAGWKQEAQKRLNDLRSKQQRHSARDAPDHLTPAGFKTSLETKTTLDPEQYIQLAERKILPNISRANLQDQDFQLALLLAQHFESAHSDRFFIDLMRSADRSDFHEAARLLGKASSANNAGHSEEAYSDALGASRLFQRLDNPAGVTAAGFEETYALHFESQAGQCAETAANVANAAERHGYAWLQAQALLERAICFNMRGDLGRAKEWVIRAIDVSKDHDYQSFRLRGLVLLASLELDAGNEASAWEAIREGLEQYWASNLPSMRAYSFYVLLDTMAERMGHWNVQSAAAFEALQFIAGGPDHVIEAEERSRLAGVALRLDLPQLAEQEFREAARLFSSAPDTASVQWRVLEAKIDLANVQSLQSGRADAAFTALLAYLPEVEHLSNRYIESQYYTTLGRLKLRMGDVSTATKYLRLAILLADNGLHSLFNWQDRLKWMEQNRAPYLLMTELLFRTEHQKTALNLWEHFRTASSESFRETNLSRKMHEIPAGRHNPSVRDVKILTYALAPDGFMVWMQDEQDFHSIFVPVSPADFKRAAESFIEECSRPASDLSNLRNDAHLLYSWLIQPVSAWLSPTGRLLIRPDGLLGSLPMEALMDSSGAYLGDRYSVTLAPAMTPSTRGLRSTAVSPSDPALVVAAPTNSEGSLEPPPGSLSEANEIAHQFVHATLLSGSKARIAAVQREIVRSNVFHFAGHATFARAGAAMLLADGNLDIRGMRGKHSNSAEQLADQSLRRIKLAVFSACGTARPSEASQWNSVVTDFLQAGTEEVVASRWNVDSAATAEFMASFYGSVLSGSTVPSALQTAAKKLRTTPGTTHPYYWAAFSSFGAV